MSDIIIKCDNLTENLASFPFNKTLINTQTYSAEKNMILPVTNINDRAIKLSFHNMDGSPLHTTDDIKYSLRLKLKWDD